MMMIKTTIIPTKMAPRVVLLSAVLMDMSADAQVVGVAGQVAGVGWQVASVAGEVEGCCLTITPE